MTDKTTTAGIDLDKKDAPLTYTVDGVVMSQLEYIDYLHSRFNTQQAAPEAPTDGAATLLDALANKGGVIVNTASLNVAQIAAARIEGRMYVREDGCGFVHAHPPSKGYSVEPYRKFMGEWSGGWPKAEASPLDAPAPATQQAAGAADCHASCGYIGAECNFPQCKSRAPVPAATTASALPLITDADLPATLEPGFYLVGVTLKGERTPAPATTASASGVIGAGDPEAFFWEFCEKQGYPSDSDMDDALRASFYEGIRYCAVHTPAPAPSREAAPLDDGFLYMCAIEAAYPIPNNPHNSVVQRAMDSRTAFRKGWDAARAALAQQGAGQAAQDTRDADRYRVLRSGRFIDLPQMVVPFTDGQQLYTPEKLDAICDECIETLKAQEIKHRAATAIQKGEQA